MTLVGNGINGPLPLSRAWDIAAMLEATGRTIPRYLWVDRAREEMADARMDAFAPG